MSSNFTFQGKKYSTRLVLQAIQNENNGDYYDCTKSVMQILQENSLLALEKTKPQAVFIDKKWLNKSSAKGEAKEFINAIISGFRKDFCSLLNSQGFEVLHDAERLPKDVIYLTRAAEIYDANSFAQYLKDFNEKIALCCGEDLKRPKTFSVDEFLRKVNPELPIVFKNEGANRGDDKFLLEEPWQLEIVREFCSQLIKIDPTALDCCVFQEFIETPSEHNTSLRVMMSASGDVMATSLKYSTGTNKKQMSGRFERFFCDENSPWYLGCRSILSNHSAGGKNIVFGRGVYSKEERDILRAHGFNPNNPTLPEDVMRVVATIARECNRELGITCGIDFILDARDGKWKLLEANASPDLKEYAEMKGIKQLGHLDVYEMDLAARYEALLMCMGCGKVLNKRKSHGSRQSIEF